jgi:hypothetical protein
LALMSALNPERLDRRIAVESMSPSDMSRSASRRWCGLPLEFIDRIGHCI